MILLRHIESCQNQLAIANITKIAVKPGATIGGIGVMMDSRLVGIARRATKLKSWEWMPGMLAVRDTPEDKKDYLKPEVRILGIKDVATAVIFRSIPDLLDAATLGVLLSLVRKIAKDDRAYLCDFGGHDSVQWAVVSTVISSIREEKDLKPRGWFREIIGDASTEGEALIIALETAEKFYGDLYLEQSNGGV